MMKRVLKLVLGVALALGMGSQAYAAADKPLVVESGKVKQLPASTTLQLNASGTGAASINIPHGAAPTSPTNGDCWTTTGGLFCRVNGSTVGPYATGTGGNVQSKDEGSSLTSATTSVDFVGSGVTATNTGGAVTVTIPGVAGGAWTMISTTTLVATATNVTFSSIPGTYKDLIVVAQVRSDKAATNDDVRVQLNGDTGTNYDYDNWNRFGAGSVVSAAFMLAAQSSAATSTANTAAVLELTIPNYAGTTFHKELRCESDTIATSTPVLQIIVGRWKSAAAVTSIKLFSPANNWIIGSTFTLYARS
jgi:hypothetical protein